MRNRVASSVSRALRGLVVFWNEVLAAASGCLALWIAPESSSWTALALAASVYGTVRAVRWALDRKALAASDGGGPASVTGEVSTPPEQPAERVGANVVSRPEPLPSVASIVEAASILSRGSAPRRGRRRSRGRVRRRA